MSTTYKPSMFNYISTNEERVILYNSFVGVKGIVEIERHKLEHVMQLLLSDGISDNDTITQTLISGGFLVDIRENEISKRNAEYARFVTRPSLLVVLHTTKRCNFRCPYCNLSFENEDLAPDVETGIEKFIQRNIGKYSDVQIDWFGGEPLLHMGSIERLSKNLISLCNRSKIKYRATITTNGYLLNLATAQRLVENGVHAFSITMDGLPTTHNKQRVLANGDGTHEQLINNMLEMKNNIKNSNLRVVIRTNITKSILSQIEEYYQYYNELFGDDKRFTILVRPAIDIGGDRVGQLIDDFLSNAEFNTAIRRLSKIAKPIGLQFANNYTDYDRCGLTCTAACENKYTVATNGRLSKCDAVLLDNDIGTLNKDGSITAGQTYQEDWVGACFTAQEECENCFMSSACMRGQCPMTRIRGDAFVCNIDTEALDVVLQLYAATHNISHI
jgi:uncharacterized protein